MNHKKELRIAYWLMIILFVVGVITYAACSKKSYENPLRIMYKTSAGNVLFDHKTHASEIGYGVVCSDCHHHPEDDDSGLTACNSCHTKDDKNTNLPESCLDCHDAGDIEGTEMKNSIDVFHDQCIACHKESGRGPVDCSQCHVM
ncbi:MAG: cytochrome c3 family protein [Deltaproteobacteria bacterium]|nr:cytochrome c3 family protein [Deltaproteobacteria bacterium]